MWGAHFCSDRPKPRRTGNPASAARERAKRRAFRMVIVPVRSPIDDRFGLVWSLDVVYQTRMANRKPG